MLNEHGKSLFRPWCSVQNVVLGGAVLFGCGLAIRLYSLNSSEIASWVQAFGSIAAIIGAFSISNRQALQQIANAEAEERKKRGRFKSLLVMLSDQHSNNLRKLKWAVQKENYEGGGLQPYLESGESLKWPSHLRALSSIDINQLDANHLSLLMEMQVSSEYALELCGQLKMKWEAFGDREEEIMKRLEHFSREAKYTLDYLLNESSDLR